MGEKERKPFQLTFNGLLKVDFHSIQQKTRRSGSQKIGAEILYRSG